MHEGLCVRVCVDLDTYLSRGWPHRSVVYEQCVSTLKCQTFLWDAFYERPIFAVHIDTYIYMMYVYTLAPLPLFFLNLSAHSLLSTFSMFHACSCEIA